MDAENYILIDGKKIAAEIEEELAHKVEILSKQGKRPPHLAAILVGHDGPSQTYVENKVKACRKVGFESTLLRFSKSITEQKLLNEVQRLNEDHDIDGFIVQLPLPEHISQEKINETIYPDKDVDGFTNVNFGRIVSKTPGLLPATPNGVMELLKRYKVETEGKHAVIVGHSRIVGAPLALLLSQKGNATVTQCHIYTKDLKKHTLDADILCVAVGKPGLITGDMIKKGAVVIDIGISRVEDPTKKSGFTVKGDVDFESAKSKVAMITPVPGGVGPMTIASLLLNTFQAYEKKHERLSHD